MKRGDRHRTATLELGQDMNLPLGETELAGSRVEIPPNQVRATLQIRRDLSHFVLY